MADISRVNLAAATTDVAAVAATPKLGTEEPTKRARRTILEPSNTQWVSVPISPTSISADETGEYLNEWGNIPDHVLERSRSMRQQQPNEPMPTPSTIKTTINVPTDLILRINQRSREWAESLNLNPDGMRNKWIVKVLREAVER